MNAAASIVPSMPMLTTPDRSHITPHSAARAIGVAWFRMFGAFDGITSMRKPTIWKTSPSERDPVQAVGERGDVHQTHAPPRREVRHRRLGVAARRRGVTARRTRREHRAGDEEEQDHGLEHVDQLDRDLPPGSASAPAPARIAAEQERGEHDRRAGATAPSSATAIESKPTVVPKLEVIVWVTPEQLARAGQAGQQPRERHRGHR